MKNLFTFKRRWLAALITGLFLISCKADVVVKTVISIHFSEGSRWLFADSLSVNFAAFPPLNDNIRLKKAILKLTFKNQLPVNVKFEIK
jgi:hypothetical protein